MPRSNRPRGKRVDDGDDDALDISGALSSVKRTQVRRDGTWNVQHLAGAGTTKTYTCPGCGLEILPGVAHTVAWRADGLMGEADDLAGRRHWHQHCWKIRQ